MVSIPLLLALALATSAGAPGRQDLRAQVKKHGTVEVLIVKEYSPANLPTLVANSTIVGRVLIAQVNSFLVGERISTDYTAQVLTIAKGEQHFEGKTITIRRPGGTVSIEGGTVIARDPDFPPFQIGEEYVLFLNPDGEGRFTVSFGAQGAFIVDQGKVAQVSRDTGTWNRDRGSVPLLQFLGEVGVITKQD